MAPLTQKMKTDDVDIDLHHALQKLDGPEILVHALKSCDSTQQVALALHDDVAPHGTIVWTRSQSAGRGRGGRSWLGTDDALLFSMVCRPQLPLAQLPRLTLLTGTALLCALRNLDVPVKLKWPNDVVIETNRDATDAPLGHYRKLAGILVDVSTRGKSLERAVVGVGLNAGSSTGLLDDVAIGLADISPRPRRARVIQEVLTQLREWLQCAGDDDLFQKALDEQRAHSMTLGAEIRVPDDSLLGIAKDLDADGALLVEDAQGRVHRVVAGDVWPIPSQKRYAVQDPLEHS
ncbi:MAG: biotin--[acetyl-CoA-carboxylase] ligase [Deltaproteobacteria bacterium]|nr:biotin--[acetyl-CoA-carboxylase] ligase [Deltaproteobacteria bacterium]